MRASHAKFLKFEYATLMDSRMFFLVDILIGKMFPNPESKGKSKKLKNQHEVRFDARLRQARQDWPN